MQKITSIAIAMLYVTGVGAQQSFTINIDKEVHASAATLGVAATEAQTPKTLKLYGIGNLNSETLNKVNSSGKIAVSVIPFYSPNKIRFWEVYLSFNKNATNSDSILASTILFPEVGNHSFLATVRRPYAIKGNNLGHYLSPFFEFSQKNIKVDTNSTQGKNTNGFFSTLTYTFGYSYIFNKTIEKTPIGLSMSPYISVLNVPDEDNDDYRKIFKSWDLPSELWSAGFKVIFQIKGFQIFADMRHLWGSEKKIPRELRGFNSNIGVTFNADIFEL